MNYKKNINFDDNMLQNEAPNLYGVGKGNPFSVPDGYFESLPDNALNNVKSLPQNLSIFNKIKSISSQTNYMVASSVAIIGLIVAILYFFNMSKDYDKDSINNADIAFSESPDVAETESTASKSLTPADKTSDSDISKSQYASHTPIIITPTHTSQTDVVSSMFSTEEIKKEIKKEDIDVKIAKDNIDEPENEFFIEDVTINSFICSEKPIILNPYQTDKNYIYNWSTGETTQSVEVERSGNYSVTITHPENFNVYIVKQIEVKIIPEPGNILDNIAVLCYGGTIILESKINNTDDYEFLWFPTLDTTPSITVSQPGLHTLIVKGCDTYSDSILVVVENCDVFAPNVITPDNDGINDYFYIAGLDRHPNTQLTIYSRSGKIVFETNDYQNNWDGNGLPHGAYVYILKFKNGIAKHGSLTILR